MLGKWMPFILKKACLLTLITALSGNKPAF